MELTFKQGIEKLKEDAPDFLESNRFLLIVAEKDCKAGDENVHTVVMQNGHINDYLNFINSSLNALFNQMDMLGVDTEDKLEVLQALADLTLAKTKEIAGEYEVDNVMKVMEKELEGGLS